jgi:hypothetical protein
VHERIVADAKNKSKKFNDLTEVDILVLKAYGLM